MEKWRNERIPVTRDGFPRSVTCRSLPFDALAASYTTLITIQWKKEGGSSPPSLWPRINALFKSTCFFSSSRPLVCPLFRPLPPSLFFHSRWMVRMSRGSARGGGLSRGRKGVADIGGRLEVSPCERCIVSLLHSFLILRPACVANPQKLFDLPLSLSLPPFSTDFALSVAPRLFMLRSLLVPTLLLLWLDSPWKRSFFHARTVRRTSSSFIFISTLFSYNIFT